MKVAHVITRLILGGAQENTLLTVEDQHRDFGDDVSLVTGPALGPEGSLIPRAEQGGFDLRIVPEMKRNIQPLSEWKAYRALKNVLREIQPELIHTHSSKAGIIGRAIAARLKIPCVHTVHGASFHYGQNPLAYRFYQAAERWAAKRCDHMITVCDAMIDQYVDANIAPREKFTTVYSGFDVEPFLQPEKSPRDIRSAFGLSDDHIVIGKIARLFHLKGHDAILNAAPDIVARNNNVRFMFVGDGLLRTEFEQQIQQMGLTDHFVFTGLVPPDRVPELIHAMDIVAHTSQWEGLARVLAQGLLAGKPVVSYNIDGAPEVVIPNETGFLVPRDDIQQLTEALLKLADNPSMREQFGQEGRRRFTDQFRHQTMTRRIREVYQRVLESKR